MYIFWAIGSIFDVYYLQSYSIFLTVVTITSYRYYRIHFTGVLLFFALSLPLILGIKKGRRFADLKGNLAIYGLFSYAHRSKFCINLKHLCSQRCLYLIQSNDSRDFEHPRVHFNRCCTDWLSS